MNRCMILILDRANSRHIIFGSRNRFRLPVGSVLDFKMISPAFLSIGDGAV